MKHILSTITVFFILLTSSMSWSKEVGYGDLRIGSDRSVINNHCEVKEILLEKVLLKYQCYDLDVIFTMLFEKNKIDSLSMEFEEEEKLDFPSFEEYKKNEKTKYYQITKKIGQQYHLDGIWVTEDGPIEDYYTSFNEGRILIIVTKKNGGGIFVTNYTLYSPKKW